MITAVRHIGVVVRDIEASLKFYRDLLGLRVVREMEEFGTYADTLLALKDVHVHTVKLAAEEGTTLIELLSFHSHQRPISPDREICSIGPSHFALTVHDVDAVYRRLVDVGVSFLAPPQRSPDGYAKVTFCRDPDGALIELVEVERAEKGSRAGTGRRETRA